MASGFLNNNILKLDYDTKTQDFLIMQKHLKDIFFKQFSRTPSARKKLQLIKSPSAVRKERI